MLDWVQDSAAWIAGVVTGLVALGVVGRWLGKRVRRSARRVTDAFDAVLGREAITHPDTGEVLAPATPGLGRRLTTIEQTLIALGDTKSELASLGRRVEELTDQFGKHVTEASELEMARTKEREEMWHAIQAVASPQPWDGAERRASRPQNAEQG